MPHSRKYAMPIVALVLGNAVCAPSLAATAASTFTVSATVQATCLITANNLAFGTYTGVLLNGTSTINVTCTNTTPYNVGLNPGVATGATVTTRKMSATAPVATLSYALFSNAGMTTNWGQTIATDTVVGTGNGASQTLTVYGQVAAGQFVAPNRYTDTVTATITY